MAKSPADPPRPSDVFADRPVSRKNFDQWVETLRNTDLASYRLMAIEVWSIAKTMDDRFPGFWSRFMTNRQQALQEFLQYKQTRTHKNSTKAKPESPS